MNANRKVAHMNYDAADRAALAGFPALQELARSRDMRFDAAEDAAVFFARELDYVKAETYDLEYPEFTALANFPVTHDVPEGAETATYYSYEKTGFAKLIANYASDLPRADVKGVPTTAHIHSIGDSYGYSIQEMRASRMTGKSLDTRKAESARYQSDRLINHIAWAGDPENNLVGILTKDNNIPLYTVSEVTEGSGEAAVSYTDWEKKSADQILGDLNGMVKYQALITKNVEKSDTLFLASSAYIDISTRKLPDSDKTVKTFLMENAPYLKKIVDCPELEADSESNPYGKRVMVLCRLDKKKFSLENPLEFLQYPIQTKGLEMEVTCEARTGGIFLYYPMSLVIALGI